MGVISVEAGVSPALSVDPQPARLPLQLGAIKRSSAPPLDFLRALRIKNGGEILWIDHSFGVCRQFFLLVSSWSSQVAVKTRVIQRRRSIWVALMEEQKVVRRGTLSPTGMGIAPTEVLL